MNVAPLRKIPPPEISIDSLCDEQANAHLWLLKQPDMIDCPRGIRMRLEACKAMQRSRKHFLRRSHALQDEEDLTGRVRIDFLVCQYCEHYAPHDRQVKEEGYTAHKQEQNIKIRAARAAEKAEHIRQTNLIAEGQRKAKETERPKVSRQTHYAKNHFTSAERQRATEIEAKYASTFAKLQEERKQKGQRKLVGIKTKRDRLRETRDREKTERKAELQDLVNEIMAEKTA